MKKQLTVAAERNELAEVLSNNIARAVIAGRALLTTIDGPYYLVFATMERMAGPYAAAQADKILMDEMRSGALIPLTAKNAPFAVTI